MNLAHYKKNMTKKEYLQKLLDKLSEEWDFATWLAIFLWNDIFNDDIIDKLYDFFSGNLKNIHDKDEKNKINNTMNFLNKMKNLENDYKTSEEELDSLLAKI